MNRVSHYHPSRASAASIISLSLLAGLAIFWALSPDVDCGAQHWSGALAAAHIGAFGILNALGWLPLGWLWWLGLFGFVGLVTSGEGVYIVN